MPLNNRMRRAHEKVILQLVKWLRKNRIGNDIQPNSRFKREHHRVPGMAITYYPDVIDRTDLKAYEVHVAGNRKEDKFALLPQGWTGINVFVVDIWEQEEVFVWNLNNQYVHVTEDSWRPVSV